MIEEPVKSLTCRCIRLAMDRTKQTLISLANTVWKVKRIKPKQTHLREHTNDLAFRLSVLTNTN